MEAGMSDLIKYDVIVIGGGIFGCLTAIELSKKGLRVQLHEKNDQIMIGASLNNQNRLHLGYHYPRDLETASQCQKGFEAFKTRFSECILEKFCNAYFISSTDSNVKFTDYKKFCEAANLPIRKIDLDNFIPTLQNIDGGLFTDEVVYDSSILKRLVLKELEKESVDVVTKSNVKSIYDKGIGFVIKTEQESFETLSVVNCTYANFNDFNKELGLVSQRLQFELTIVPIIKWRKGLDPIGITVMDGKFFTVLPFGKTNNYLLYHVDHTVQETIVRSHYPTEWRNTKDYVGEDVAIEAFNKMKLASSKWLPSILDAEYIDYLTTVRVVLADVESTDRRPSLISRANLSSPFYNLFSGKIDHSIWVAEEISNKLFAELYKA
jgi:hypothetical protein